MSEVKVKKAYEEVVAFLEENANLKVKSILDEVIKMCSAKSAGGVVTASHSVDGKVVAVRCSHFGKWFALANVEFGAKASSATGLNSMCKEGANAFSFAQRTFKKAKEAILDDVMAGNLAAEDVQPKLEALEAARVDVGEYSIPGLGFDKLEDLLAADPVELQALVDAAAPVAEDDSVE